MNINSEIDRVLDLSQAEIGLFTVPQLKIYIRQALNIVNNYDYMYVEDYDIDDTYEMLKENFDFRFGKMVGHVSGNTKQELFEKALDLKVHMKSIADFYAVDNGELNDRARKTYEKVKERWGDENLKEQEFNRVVELFAYFGQDVLEKYIDSDQIYSTYSEVFEEYGERTANTLFDLMKSEYKYMMRKREFKGLTKDDFTRIFMERVKDRLKEY